MRDFARGMHGSGMLTSPKVVVGVRPGPLPAHGGPGRSDGPFGDRGLRKVSATARNGFRFAASGGAGARAGGAYRRRASASKSWPAISSKTNCPRPTSTRWAAFCTIGREDKIGLLLRKILARLPAGGGAAAGGEATERRWRGAGASEYAIAQHAGSDGRPRAQLERILAPAARGGIRGSGRAADGHGAGCDLGCEGLAPSCFVVA